MVLINKYIDVISSTSRKYSVFIRSSAAALALNETLLSELNGSADRKR